MEKKVAVFSRKEEFEQIRFKPKSKFVWVKDIESIRGIKFDGVISIGNNWHYDSNKDYAYCKLIERFPKFKP